MAAHAVDVPESPASGSAPGGLTPPRRMPSIDGYEVRRQLGETPAGDVYLAAHTASGALRTIAVQRGETDPAAVRLIVREVLEASRVKHPSVALVDGVGTTRDGRLYVATGYVPGATLAEILADEGHLPARRAVQIALRAAQALAAAHAQGVVHGDLTPEHIIVGPAGPDGVEPVGVTGFGMTTARTGSPTPVAPGKSARPYASPERAAGGAVDARSDVFALASIMLHALSGNAPPPPRASTGRGNTPAFSAAIQPGQPAPRLAPAQVLLAARAVEPERRYPSALAFHDTLAAAFGEGEESRRTPERAPAAVAPAPAEPPFLAARATPADASPAVLTPASVPVVPPPRTGDVWDDHRPTAAEHTPASGSAINPYLRRTPAAAFDAVEPVAADMPRDPLPPSPAMAPLAFGPPPASLAEANAPDPVAPAAPFSGAYTPAPSVPAYTPAAAPVAVPAPQQPALAPAAGTSAASGGRGSARRRGMMIGGVAAAALLVGAWSLISGPAGPEPVAPRSAASETAGEQPQPAAPARPLGGLVAAAVRLADSAVGDAPDAEARPGAARAEPGTPKAVASAPTAAETPEPPKEESAPPMPRVVVPDVAMRGDAVAADARLSQSALSEVSVAADPSAPVAEGAVLDAATRSQINAAMARFARALESRDLGTLRQAYPGITASERDTWTGFFRSAESIRARFTAQDFQVMPGGVDVNAVGKLTFYKRDTRQQTENAVTFRVLLTQARGGGFVMKKIH